MNETPEQVVNRFRFLLMQRMPFYGDIVMALPFIANEDAITARTNGKVIEYNPNYLMALKPEHQNFLLFHEIFHVLLGHCGRSAGKDPEVWNIAADCIVNYMLGRYMHKCMEEAGLPFRWLPEAIDGERMGIAVRNETVESLYQKLLKRRKWSKADGTRFTEFTHVGSAPSIADDIIRRFSDLKPDDATEAAQQEVAWIIQNTLGKTSRSALGHLKIYIPEEFPVPKSAPRLNWKKLLRDYLSQVQSEELSYITPERKYIHMDLILPGHGLSGEELDEVWAFVDCSISIGQAEMDVFLSELYHIVRSFHCSMNLCYWNTTVDDVYLKIKDERELLRSTRHHTGGTDINCVYKWIKDNHVRPGVMLILTDGEYGSLRSDNRIPSLRSKTILVLGPGNLERPDMRQLGRIAKL